MADEISALAGAPAVKITVRPNGPFRVEGPIELVDVAGNKWDLTDKPAISLCRCGLSSKRPFCDGTHGREGWKCDASPIPVEPVAQGRLAEDPVRLCAKPPSQPYRGGDFRWAGWNRGKFSRDGTRC